ncbi:MlaE family ABC transporter permease [Amycolatopsis sp.]|uniref:MlaE family ABC transporter permease n=1 Tax=Amycolatopsis sp. TaxID=37632 RepID=UPI002CA5DAEC|nr:ABC transporter permease [Amycolatopsis sp.]HVV08207.1 ABC transporter permease [Amycolatopsis sp.]
MSPVAQRARRALSAPGTGLEKLGEQLAFHGKAYVWSFRAIARYKKEIARQLASVSLGTGAMALVGGTAVVVAFLTGAAGVEVALQGYSQLANVGVEALSGFISAYVNTRIAAPLIAGVAMVATVGAGFTAELGAMRISEEIDALEVMAVPSIPFLVTSRILAGFIAVTPLYAIALFMSYGLTRMTVVLFYGQSAGSYDHYFATFLVPADILSSFVEVLAMSVVVMSVHCYYGFTAAGGPAGVGAAVGRAVRLSLIGVMFVAFAVSLVLYGNSNTLHISR